MKKSMVAFRISKVINKPFKDENNVVKLKFRLNVYTHKEIILKKVVNEIAKNSSFLSKNSSLKGQTSP